MKSVFWTSYIIAMLVLIGMLTLLFIHRAEADCVHIWSPGKVTYVEAGQEIHFVVEEEDADAYRNQKTKPKPVPISDTRNAFQKALNNIPDLVYCGEYSEIGDEDLE